MVAVCSVLARVYISNTPRMPSRVLGGKSRRTVSPSSREKEPEACDISRLGQKLTTILGGVLNQAGVSRSRIDLRLSYPCPLVPLSIRHLLICAIVGGFCSTLPSRKKKHPLGLIRDLSRPSEQPHFFLYSGAPWAEQPNGRIIQRPSRALSGGSTGPQEID